jgi:hypothetical protein
MLKNKIEIQIRQAKMNNFCIDDETSELSWQARDMSDRIKIAHIDRLTVKDGLLILESTIGTCLGMHVYQFSLMTGRISCK